MHREISHTDELVDSSSPAGLYLLTGVVTLLLGIDLWPVVARWLTSWNLGITWPEWERAIYGYRYAMIAALLGGARVLLHSLESLFEGKLSADLAIAIACVAAIRLNDPIVAAEVIVIGLIGECLEAITFAHAQRGIRKLVEVFPRKCWVLRDGQEVAVYTSQVVVGERVVIKPGRKIPVDGVVVEGRSAVDCSPLTGESIPVDKGVGDEVLAGSLNQFGQLIVEARKVAKETVAGQVIELTARALKNKSPIERQVDRLAKFFVPVVLGLAFLTFLIHTVYHAGPFRSEFMRISWASAARLAMPPTLGVLVVACPCALVLATPAAVIAAIGRLAGTGVLLKGGIALEKLASVKAFAFDKTGTLTEGKLELGSILAVEGITHEELLRIAAEAEQGSEHPLGRLILQAAHERGLPLQPLENFAAFPGAGIQATIAGSRVLVGTRRLLSEQGISLSPQEANRLVPLEETGETLLLVARDGVFLGAIGARDRLRNNASDVVASLRNLGIQRVALLTGDRLPVARNVAATLQIDDVHAELLPTEKARLIEEMQAVPQGGTALPVCFVGDGINDAPGLAVASVGIAVGSSGSDIAAEAGDVILMGEPLEHLPFLVRLSRETVRIIGQNILIFAFAVNLFGVLLTGFLFPFLVNSPEWYDQSPLVGVLYHQIGSILVLFNSMRLLAFERVTNSPGWQKLGNWWATADLWMQRNLRVDVMLDEALHRWASIAITLLILITLLFLSSGFYQIEPDEVGVVKRFGAIVDEIHPGLHWRWPWPVEQVIRLRPHQMKVVGLGYRNPEEELEEDALRVRTSPAEQEVQRGSTWTSAHEGTERYAGETAMITGDYNLVEILATIQYQINNPRLYIVTARERRPLLRSATEGVIRELVAGLRFSDLQTTLRADFEQMVTRRVKQRLEQLAPGGLGIRLVGVIVHDLHPPREVVDDYYKVSQAIQKREQFVNMARAEAIRVVRRAEERAISMVNQALTNARKEVEKERTQIANVLSLQEARARLAPEEEAQLLHAMAHRLAAGESIGDAMTAMTREWEKHLHLRRSLIDYRLAWEELTQVLSKRDKIIIQAENLTGRRGLYFVTPDFLRPPMLMPADRNRPIPTSEGH